jgi:hypothetical protein
MSKGQKSHLLADPTEKTARTAESSLGLAKDLGAKRFRAIALAIGTISGRDWGMVSVDSEIEAYKAMLGELEQKYMGKWVIFHDCKLVGVFDSFDAAAEDAVKRFGRGPYLIRQVGAPPITLPACVMYGLCYA